MTSGGSGYVTTPAITIVADGGGSNATAVAQISGGVVTNISITDAGIGYTNTPTVQIDPPPAAALSPTVLPMMRWIVELSPYDNYQIQSKSALAERGPITTAGCSSNGRDKLPISFHHEWRRLLPPAKLAVKAALRGESTGATSERGPVEAWRPAGSGRSCYPSALK